MKARFVTGIALLLFGAALAMAAEGTWTGYITDSKCGVKGAHEGARDCAIKCVSQGAKYVFVDDEAKKVYVVAEQDKVAEHAGHHVTVKGTIDGDTIKVESIEMAAATK